MNTFANTIVPNLAMLGAVVLASTTLTVAVAWIGGGRIVSRGFNMVKVSPSVRLAHPFLLLFFVAALFALTVPAARAYSWTNSIIDNIGDVGSNASTAYSAGGDLGIAYYDATQKVLKYISYNGASWNSPVIVDDGAVPGNLTTNDVGRAPSLKFDPSTKRPMIAYRDHTAHSLKFAKFNGSVWVKETIAAEAGFSNSLSFTNAGFPAIATSNNLGDEDDDDGDFGNPADGCVLSYYVYNGASWGSMLVKRIPNVVGGQFRYLSLAFNPSSGYPSIAFEYAVDHDLYYHNYNVGGVWVGQSLDTLGEVGRYASLAFDPSTNLPSIAYYDTTNSVLRFAKSIGGGNWTVSNIENGTGIYGSLAYSSVSGTPRPVVAYMDSDNGDLVYSAFDGTNWFSEVVDATANHIVGQSASIAIHPTNFTPSIAYYDSSSKVLKYAKGNPVIGTGTRDLPGTTFKYGQLHAVKLSIKPGPDVNSYSVFEYLPVGWSLDSVPSNGATVAVQTAPNGAKFIKWDVPNGNNFDVTYYTTSTSNSADQVDFSGQVYIAGVGSKTVLGDTHMTKLVTVPTTMVRDLPTVSAGGESFPVEIDVKPGTGVGSYKVLEKLPAGITASYITPTPTSYDTATRVITWQFANGLPATLSYVAKVKNYLSSGQKAFSGTYTTNGGATQYPVNGDTQVLIPDKPTSISRTLPATADPGDGFPVQITVTPGTIDSYKIVETLPAGFTASNYGSGVYNSQTRTIAWDISDVGPATLGYTATSDPQIPAGSKAFSGAYTLNGAATQFTVSGNNSVEIQVPQNPEPTPVPPSVNSAIRVLPATYQAEAPFGVQIVVTPDSSVDNHSVTEVVPQGWVIDEVSSPEFLTTSPDASTLIWAFPDHAPRVLTFTVTPPSGTVGLKSFAGHLTVNGTDIPTIGDLSTNSRVQQGKRYLYVGSNGSVDVYDALTGDVVKPGFITSLTSPRGILLRGDKLYIADAQSHSIGTYNPLTGQALDADLITGVSAEDIVIRGNLLYAAEGDQIGVYDATTGAAFDNSPFKNHDTVSGLAVANGRLYVAESGNGTIATYDLANVNAPTFGFITDVNLPAMTDVDISEDGTLYFSRSNFGSIAAYDAGDGALLNYGLLNGLNYPAGLDEGDGVLYVADSVDGSIIGVDAHLGTPQLIPITGLNGPRFVHVATNPDLDGDGVLNGDDPDMDDDGEPNGTDPDMDDDDRPNNEDPDSDGDNIPNDEDTTPGGTGTGTDSQYHPADTWHDLTIDIDEVSAYADAYISGTEWGNTGQSVDIDYLSRAEDIWLRGETYTVDNAQSAPLKWVPLP